MVPRIDKLLRRSSSIGKLIAKTTRNIDIACTSKSNISVFHLIEKIKDHVMFKEIFYYVLPFPDNFRL